MMWIYKKCLSNDMQPEKRSAHMRFKQKNEKKWKFNGEKKIFFNVNLKNYVWVLKIFWLSN